MTMYNKIFTKILDSSVWLEPTPTRIVWITLIAAMDENGFCQFAAVGNVASRARVTEEEARKALNALEGPDAESSDQDNDGRRIERVPGGWMVLNAPKYRALVTRVNVQERTRDRVRRFREKKRSGNAPVTLSNASETQSEADSPSKAEVQKPSRGKRERATKTDEVSSRHAEFKAAIKAYWDYKNPGLEMPWGGAEGKQLGMWLREAPHITLEQFKGLLRARAKSAVNHGDRPCQWIKWITSYGPGPIDRFKNTAGGEDGTGKDNPSPAKQRVDGNRRALAEAAIKRGWYDPHRDSGGGAEAVAESGHGGVDGRIPGGLREADPEILPPESRKGA